MVALSSDISVRVLATAMLPTPIAAFTSSTVRSTLVRAVSPSGGAGGGWGTVDPVVAGLASGLLPLPPPMAAAPMAAPAKAVARRREPLYPTRSLTHSHVRNYPPRIPIGVRHATNHPPEYPG